jgi:hypothetical protein
MNRIAWTLLFGLILCATQTGPAVAADARTLKGGFVWTQGSEGDLEAVFIPAGEDRWEVSFHFTFRGEDHTYTGEAEGSLNEGSLSGTVLNETKKRTFTFTGEFEKGEFRGTHAEVGESGERKTGTLTLAE